MLRLIGSAPVAAASVGALTPMLSPTEASAAIPHGPLVWSDDFNYFDTRKWKKGPDNWPDRYGTIAGWDPGLVTVGDSKLRLRVAKRNGAWYGGLVHGRGLAAFKYGYFEIRAKLPAGQGLWSALWMMPRDNAYGVWPNSGEIDILEYIGKPQEVTQGYTTLHFANGPAVSRAATGTNWSLAWHTWGCLWDRTSSGSEFLRFYVDGNPYGTITETQWPAVAGHQAGSPFDQAFYFVLNLTVGGIWAGSPSDAMNGRTLEIDWIRVYKGLGS